MPTVTAVSSDQDMGAALARAITGHAASATGPAAPAVGELYHQVQQQAAMLSYIDVFYLLMFIAIGSLPLIFRMHKNQASAGMRGAA